MATISYGILEAAHEDGLLPKRLTKNQVTYLHDSVLTANKIYWAIADAEQGLDLEQLCNVAKKHENTLKQYCRWLMTKNLVYAEEYGLGGKYVYFAKKKRFNVRTK